MRIWSALIFFGIISFASQSRAGQTSFRDALRGSYDRSLSRVSKTEETLKNLNIDAVAPAEEQAVALFAKGLAIFEDNPEQAKMIFESAQKILPQKSPLHGLVSIYQGRSSLTKANAKSVLAKLNALSKGNINKSPIWRPEKFALMMEIVMLLEQDKMLVRAWTDMMVRVKPAHRDERLSAKVISYLENRDLKNRPEIWPIVESLASDYPHSESGRWGFQKLQELSSQSPKPYVYSLAFITRLSSNLNLDEGLKYFLIELTQGPVRFASGRIGRMDEIERINYLYQNRFWNESRRLLEGRLEELAYRQNEPGRIERAKAINLLGQIQTRQGDYEGAIRTLSLYIETFQDVVDTRMATESLADCLSKLRYHRQSAKIYEQLAKRAGVDPLIRWHHFWNLYLAGDHAEAIALLNRGSYVPHRDRGFEGGLDYWKARILEKQNKLNEAQIIYKKILTENGNGFYANLIQARSPAMMDAIRRNINPNISSVNRQDSYENDSKLDVASLNSAADDGTDILAVSLEGVPSQGAAESRIGSSAVDREYASHLQTASALGKWGRRQIGRRLLRLLPVVGGSARDSAWRDTFRLALDLRDFSFGFKAPQIANSPLRRIPNSAADLEVHMLQYNSDWKLLYPYAYREIVDPIARSVGVDPFLLLSLMRAESIYDEDAQSHVGAQGLMQIMPFTAIRLSRVLEDGGFELNQLRRPEINIGYAAYYVRKLTDYYKGNSVLAVAAYNGGPTSVNRWLANFGDLEADELIETMSFRETRRYVKSVFKNMGYYKFIWQQTRALAAIPQLPDEPAGGEIF